MSDTIKIALNYEKPVELIDISLSLSAIGAEFQAFSERSSKGVPGSKLYLHKVEQGSLIAELIALSDQASVFVEQGEAIAAFIGNFKWLTDFLLGEKVDKPNFDKKQLDRLDSFLNPVAKDAGATWHISNNGGGSVTINYQEANALQNAVSRERNLLKEPLVGLHEQVVLTFQQTRNDPDTGNRAKIESIYHLPVKVVFANEDVHQAMPLNDENPLTGIYLVDVRVETVNNKPILYKITRFHERIEV